MATLDDHSTQHRATWDGLNHRGERVPDGTYVVNIEVTEDEFDYGRRSQYSFEKGRDAVELSPDPQWGTSTVTLRYTPEGG